MIYLNGKSNQVDPDANHVQRKHNEPVTTNIGSKERSARYETSSDVLSIIKDLFKRIISLVNNKFGNKDIKYADNKKVADFFICNPKFKRETLPLDLSLSAKNELNNGKPQYFKGMSFGLIDPYHPVQSTSFKLLTYNDTKVVSDQLNASLDDMLAFIDEQMDLCEKLTNYIHRENGVIELRNVPRDMLIRVNQLSLMNEMFLKFITNAKELNTIENLNPSLYVNKSSNTRTLLSEMLSKSTLENDEKTSIRLNELDDEEELPLLNMTNPSGNMRDFTLTLQSYDDHYNFTESMKDGMRFVRFLMGKQVEMNDDLEKYLYIRDKEYILKAIPPRLVNRLAKIELFNMMFLDFMQTLKDFDSQTKGVTLGNATNENHG